MTDDDLMSERLRQALRAEADTVQPRGDGLARIRARVNEERVHAWWRRPAVALAAAAVLGVTVAGVAVAIGRDGQPDTAIPPAGTPSVSSSPSVSSPTTSPSPTSSPTQTDDGGTGETVTVPVYYLADIEHTGPRLFREFHVVPASPDGAAAAALRDMLRDRPADPDYSSPWPAGTQLLSLVTDGDTATVDLSADARESAPGASFSEMAVQQLVYTVTAADPTVRQVRLLIDGEPAGELWGHLVVTDPLTRAPMLDVLGLQWILAPTEDATSGSPVRLQFYGTGFEGQIDWKVLREGTEVASGFTTGEQGVFRVTDDSVELAPGTYEIQVADTFGEPGLPRVWDTKTFTVE